MPLDASPPCEHTDAMPCLSLASCQSVPAMMAAPLAQAPEADGLTGSFIVERQSGGLRPSPEPPPPRA